MEEIEIGSPWEFSKSIEVMSLISSKITSNPLFSCVVSFYILVFLYFPHGFSLKIILSPVLIITASILLSLLRLGAIQKFHPDNRGKFNKTEKTEFSVVETKKLQSFNEAEETELSIEESIKIQSFNDAGETKFSIGEIKKIQSFNEAEAAEFPDEEPKKIQSLSEAEETEFPNKEPTKIQSLIELEEADFSDEEPKKVQSFRKTEETEFWEEGRKWVGNVDEAEEIDNSNEEFGWVDFKKESESETKLDFRCFDPDPSFEPAFVKWDVGAPLEVIYEENEGEEDENETPLTIYRYPLFSPYFMGSDSDSSSENDFPATWGKVSPEKMGFRWEEEDKDELIEIALGIKGLDFHGEEEMNLIEIDISGYQKV